jgi:hypothetical protein
MNPLQRAKQHIEETVERRRREQQERLNSRSTAADHGRVQEAYQTQPFVIGVDLANGADHTVYRECASPSHTATDTGSSSSSDSCSSTSSSSDY